MMNSRMFLVAALAAALSSAVSANELDEAVLHGETDKPRAIDYKPGETMTFTLSLRGAGRLERGKYFIDWSRTGDDGR